MRRLIVEAAAEADIAAVYEQGLRLFGLRRADRYIDELYEQLELLTIHPGLGRRVKSLRYSHARMFGCGVHIIIYTPMAEETVINRIFDARSNFARHL